MSDCLRVGSVGQFVCGLVSGLVGGLFGGKVRGVVGLMVRGWLVGCLRELGGAVCEWYEGYLMDGLVMLEAAPSLGLTINSNCIIIKVDIVQ